MERNEMDVKKQTEKVVPGKKDLIFDARRIGYLT